MTDNVRKLKQEASRGVLAQQVMENPIFQEALMLIRADLMLKFERTKFKDSDERDEIWREMNTLANIEQKLKKTLENGKLCQNELTVFQKTRRKIGL